MGSIFKRADDSQAGQRGEGCPDAPDDGIEWFPGSFVGEDVRPCLLAEDEEHEHIEKPQEVNVDRADAVVFVGYVRKIAKGLKVMGISLVAGPG